MADIVELNQLEALAPHRQRWESLLLRTPGATFFQSLDWLEAYWRHFGQGRRLRVLLVSDGGEIRAFVPLVARRSGTTLGPMPMVVWPLDAWGTFFGPIGHDPTWALNIAIDYLRSGPRDWELIDLAHLGSADSRADHWTASLRDVAPGCVLREYDRSAVIDFDGSWDKYLQSRSSHWRRNFRAAERRLMSRGDVRFERFRPAAPCESVQSPLCMAAVAAALAAPDGPAAPPAWFESGLSAYPAPQAADPRWDLFGACQQVAAASWQASAERGTTLSSESIRGFLRDVHHSAVARGAVDLCLLWCGDQPVAFQYNYYWNGCLFGLRQGYDPQFARYSVGMALMGMAIRDSFERGDRLLDLGTGSGECKSPLATRTVGVGRLTCFRRTSLRAQLLRLGRWCRRWWKPARA